MGSISLRLSDEMEERLATEAEGAGIARSEVVRVALAEYLARRERERFMAEMVAEMRAGYGDPERRREAMELADELLALDDVGLGEADPAAGPAAQAEPTADKWWK